MAQPAKDISRGRVSSSCCVLGPVPFLVAVDTRPALPGREALVGGPWKCLGQQKRKTVGKQSIFQCRFSHLLTQEPGPSADATSQRACPAEAPRGERRDTSSVLLNALLGMQGEAGPSPGTLTCFFCLSGLCPLYKLDHVSPSI